MKRIIGTSRLKSGLIKSNRSFIFSFSVFAFGIFIGAVWSGMNFRDENCTVMKIWQNFLNSRSGQSIFLNFLSSFGSCFAYAAASYVFGVCAVGFPFLLSVMLVLGTGKGIILSVIFLNFGLGGFIKSLLVIVPLNVAICFIIFIAVNFSLGASEKILKNLMGIMAEPFDFRKYNRTFVCIILAAVPICFLDAVTAKLTSFPI